ncbi:hypothetical protein [Rahnella sp. PCH160]|uniref:hypothetical protein n=1 Tax=Rahnella sp. PCH160 TaxID=3447928 RepID=UPI0039FDBCD6
MKERPILFNAEMVKAILSGRKTQTRRVIRDQPFDRSQYRHDHQIEIVSGRADLGDEIDGLLAYSKSSGGEWHAKCPLGQPGDQLWVREAFASGADFGESDVGYFYRATDPGWDDNDTGARWRPSIHMPRAASRIDLLITGVRVERLNDISEQDARAEGIIDGGCLNCGEPEPCVCSSPKPDATESFAALWQSIYGEKNWFINPWVWVIEFEHLRAGRKG